MYNSKRKWYIWQCPECGYKIRGYLNDQGQISFRCRNCRAVTVTTMYGPLRNIIEVYPADDREPYMREIPSKTTC